MFWKKKKKNQVDDIDISEENTKSISKNSQEVPNANENTEKLLEKATIYEELLAKDKTDEDAQAELLKIYNELRKDALKNKNITLSLEYLDKVETVMKISKDSIRGI